jgi:hypothetical protein
MKTRILATTFFMVASSLVNSATIFTDSFETGNLSASNANGFRWGEPNKTTVVNQNNVTYGTNLFSGSNWTPYDGNFSLRFQYPAGNSISEQRFTFGNAAYKDVWFKYWLRVPTNFTHSSGNHKLFAIWMDNYSDGGTGSTVLWEFWPDGSGGSRLAFHYVPFGGSDSYHMQGANFISVPADRGRWMEVVLRIKASTTNSARDGIIQMWRRWQNESTFTKLHDYQNVDLGASAGGSQGWANGYFMGWTNGPYAANTEWLMDNLTIADQSLLTITGTSSSPTISPPAAPALSVQPR